MSRGPRSTRTSRARCPSRCSGGSSPPGARRAASGPPAPPAPGLSRRRPQQMVRRLVATVRDAHHGGTIVIVPPERAEEVLAGEHVSLKHAFVDGEPRRRFRTLIVRIMNRLAQSHGRGGEVAYPRAVGWEEYVWSEDRMLAELDEAIFEFAHLVAGLAAVDRSE